MVYFKYSVALQFVQSPTVPDAEAALWLTGMDLTQSWALGLASNMQALPDAPPAKQKLEVGRKECLYLDYLT